MQPHEILEALTHRGYAPTLLYDDNGHWLVTDIGMQPMGGGEGEYAALIGGKERWHDNITDAVNAYLYEAGGDI